jgi:hypothetical protein
VRSSCQNLSEAYLAIATAHGSIGFHQAKDALLRAAMNKPPPFRIQLHPPHASTGKTSPHGELGIAGGPPAPAPELPLLDPELPPPEPPLDTEALAPPPVVVLVVAPVSLQ